MFDMFIKSKFNEHLKNDKLDPDFMHFSEGNFFISNY